MPEPIFRSPRNLRKWLIDNVRRRWHAQARELASQSSRDMRFCVVLEQHGSHFEIQDSGQYPTTPTLSGLGNVTQFRLEWKGLMGSGTQIITGLTFYDGEKRYGCSSNIDLATADGVSSWMTFTSISHTTFPTNRVRISLLSNDMFFTLDGELCVVFR